MVLSHPPPEFRTAIPESLPAAGPEPNMVQGRQGRSALRIQLIFPNLFKSSATLSKLNPLNLASVGIPF